MFIDMHAELYQSQLQYAAVDCYLRRSCLYLMT